jgi:transcriptional regulator
VHLTGTVRMLSGDELGPHLDALSANFEAGLIPKPPWMVSKMTPGRLDALKKGIVGFVMSVEEVEGSFKLNQHKSDVDHLAVATALARQTEATAHIVANEMRTLRPQLFAADPAQPITLPEGTLS